MLQGPTMSALLSPTPAPSVSPLLGEIAAGQGISFPELARRFPAARGRGRLNPATAYRWALDGIALPDGGRLRLEAVRLGGRYLTTEAALLRFIAAQQAAVGAREIEAASRTATPNQRRRAAEQAGAVLERRGA
jgi:hypothetical protein